MQLSDLPARIRTAFATSGAKNTIPETTATPGAAAFDTGFPSLTMLPLASGGIPPAGQDFNGILNAITAVQRWQAAGGSFNYNAAWSTANGGYPKGAVLLASDGSGYWFNTTDNNTTDPEANPATGWVPGFTEGSTALTLSNANVTLTPLQAAKPVFTLTGTLTANVQVIVPTWRRNWLVVNATSGGFSVTVKTPAGTGTIAVQGASTNVWGDGTNVGGALALPAGSQAVSQALGVRGNVLATMQSFSTEFASSLLASGWQKLPSGVILQWGRTPLSIAGLDVGGTFPITFPNGVGAVIFQPDKTTGDKGVMATLGAVSTGAYGYSAWSDTNTRVVGLGAYFLAIGF